MIAAKVHRRYREYATITREQAFARHFDGTYLNAGTWPAALADYESARDLFGLNPAAIAVDFAMPSHNTAGSRYVPPKGYIIYVKAVAGSWAKPVRVIVHPALESK